MSSGRPLWQHENLFLENELSTRKRPGVKDLKHMDPEPTPRFVELIDEYLREVRFVPLSGTLLYPSRSTFARGTNGGWE
jgi:hypothetical protein